MWTPDPAVVHQQQDDSGYTIVRGAVAVSERDWAAAAAWAAARGVPIFNPDSLRSQARLPRAADLRQRVVAALRSRGWLAGGRAPAAAVILHSAVGCRAQNYHFDFDANAVVAATRADAKPYAKPYSVLLALEDDTTLDLLPGGAPLALRRGDLLMWHGDVAHRGAGYPDKANTRFFMYVNARGISAPVNGTYPYDAARYAAQRPPADAAARQQGVLQGAAQLLTLRAPRLAPRLAPRRLGQDAAQLLTTLRAPRPLASAAAAAAAARDGCCRGIGPWLRGQRCTQPVVPGTAAALARPLCARCRDQRAAAARQHRRRRAAAAAAAPGRKSRNRAPARDTCVGCGGANAWPAHLQHPRTSRCHPCHRARRRTTRAPTTRAPSSSAAARAARRAFQVAARRLQRVLLGPHTAAARDAEVRALLLAADHLLRGGATRGTGRGAPRAAPPIPPLLDNTNTCGVARTYAA